MRGRCCEEQPVGSDKSRTRSPFRRDGSDIRVFHHQLRVRGDGEPSTADGNEDKALCHGILAAFDANDVDITTFGKPNNPSGQDAARINVLLPAPVGQKCFHAVFQAAVLGKFAFEYSRLLQVLVLGVGNEWRGLAQGNLLGCEALLL